MIHRWSNINVVHERVLEAPMQAAGEVLNSLASADDRLWPRETWPAMCFDKPLGMGAKGGHGPIRYDVTRFERGLRVCFRFTGPPGFNGIHEFRLSAETTDQTTIRHTLRMETSGIARLSWPVFYRPLHDALIEDAFEKAERELGLPVHRTPWSGWVRLLRFVLKRISGRAKTV